MRFNSVILAAAAAVACVAQVNSAHADSISTGIANWQLVSIQSFGNPAYIPGISTVGNSAIPVTTPNAGWGATSAIAAWEAANIVDPLGKPAQWISATANGDSEGVWGWYTFQLTITPSQPGTYTFFGALSADNMVDSFKINGVEQLGAPYNPNTVPVASPSPVYGFNYTYTFSGGAPSPLVLTVRVYNESVSGHFDDQGHTIIDGYPTGPSLTDATTNPLGFILAGEADFSRTQVIVPTPAAAFSGLTLLSGLAFTQLRRRPNHAE